MKSIEKARLTEEYWEKEFTRFLKHYNAYDAFLLCYKEYGFNDDKNYNNFFKRNSDSLEWVNSFSYHDAEIKTNINFYHLDDAWRRIVRYERCNGTI